MAALKLTRIGNSVGVILPKDMLARLKVEKGDIHQQPSARVRARCSSWANALGSRATAIKPDNAYLMQKTAESQ